MIREILKMGDPRYSEAEPVPMVTLTIHGSSC